MFVIIYDNKRGYKGVNEYVIAVDDNANVVTSHEINRAVIFNRESAERFLQEHPNPPDEAHASPRMAPVRPDIAEQIRRERAMARFSSMSQNQQREAIELLTPGERIAGYLQLSSALAVLGAGLRKGGREDETWSEEEQQRWDAATDALDPWWYAMSDEEKAAIQPVELVLAQITRGEWDVSVPAAGQAEETPETAVPAQTGQCSDSGPQE